MVGDGFTLIELLVVIAIIGGAEAVLAAHGHGSAGGVMMGADFKCEHENVGARKFSACLSRIWNAH